MFFNTISDSLYEKLIFLNCMSPLKLLAILFPDSLMLDSKGYVAESTGANIFYVKKNKLYTPIADCFLNGITRKTVIQIAKKNNIKVVEKRILLKEQEQSTLLVLVMVRMLYS